MLIYNNKLRYPDIVIFIIIIIMTAIVDLSDYVKMSDSAPHHAIWQSGVRVLKLVPNRLGEREFQTLHLFAALASDYAPKSPRLVVVVTDATMETSVTTGIEMGYAGRTIASIFYRDSLVHSISGIEFALCHLQCIEVLLLCGNALLMQDVHEGNVCYQHRGPAIRLTLIDTGCWRAFPYVDRDAPNAVLKQNVSELLRGFWTRATSPSRFNDIEEIKYAALQQDDDDVHGRLLDLATRLTPTADPQASGLTERIRELVALSRM